MFVAWLALACARRPEVVDATLTEGGGVTCDVPSTRAAPEGGWYERRAAPEQPLEVREAMLLGGGLAIEDYDGDGFLDIFIPSDTTAQLWFGRADTEFDERGATALAGLDLASSVGAVNVDYDGDGDVDLFVTRWQATAVLLENDGTGTFTDVTAGTGLDKYAPRAQSATWGDIDADGDLDLFIGAYGEWAKILDGTCTDHFPDEVAAQLWRNNGDGTFTDIRDRLPAAVHAGYIFMSGFYDIDGDSFPELFTAHDDGSACDPSVLVDNIGGEQFVVDDSSVYSRAADDMGMAVADLNGDDQPDFLLTSFQTIALLHSHPQPEADNGFIWIIADRSNRPAVDPDQQAFGWGTELGDLDNDGDDDAVATFGYWSEYDGPSDPVQQPDAVWLQGPDGFTDVAPSLGMDDSGVGRSVVLADLNRDGWLDVVKRQLDGETPMYMSNCGEEAWLSVRLEQPGPNARAIGAKIRVTSPALDRRHVRWMTAGSTGLYSGAPLAAHFGLGGAETVDVEVVWPDGAVSQALGVSTRQQVTLRRD